MVRSVLAIRILSKAALIVAAMLMGFLPRPGLKIRRRPRVRHAEEEHIPEVGR